MFLGEYMVNFSGQGRLIIPKKFREALGNTNSFTLTKGFDKCLAGFRNEDWEKESVKLMGDTALELHTADVKRYFFSSAVIAETDDQGRIIVPKNLLQYADLNGKEATLIGVGSYFEIWNNEKWTEYSKKIEKNIKNYAPTSTFTNGN